jgi:hypothetical protein
MIWYLVRQEMAFFCGRGIYSTSGRMMHIISQRTSSIQQRAYEDLQGAQCSCLSVWCYAYQQLVQHVYIAFAPIPTFFWGANQR